MVIETVLKWFSLCFKLRFQLQRFTVLPHLFVKFSRKNIDPEFVLLLAVGKQTLVPWTLCTIWTLYLTPYQ